MEVPPNNLDININKRELHHSEISDYKLVDLKEELLKAIREVNNKMSREQTQFKQEINTQLAKYDNQFDEYSIKINEANASANLDKMRLEKINDLLGFQKKANDQLVSHEVKINTLQKDLSSALYKYDKIFLDNLVIPGTIGEYCRFKNMKEYLEFNMTQVNALTTFKEKQTNDLKSYKEKLDQMINKLNHQLDNSDKNMKTYVGKLLENNEENFKKEIADVITKLNDLKIENHKYAFNLQKTATELSIEYDKILNIRAEIEKRLEEQVKKMKESHQATVDNYESMKGEFERIKKRFNEMSEFIKDVRFRKNIGGDVSRQELKKMATKLTFDRKKSIKNSEDNSIITNNKITKNENNKTPLRRNNEENVSGNDSEAEIQSYIKRYINGENLSFKHDKKPNIKSDESVSDNNSDIEVNNINYNSAANLNNHSNNRNNDRIIMELTEENDNNNNNSSKNINFIVKKLDLNINKDNANIIHINTLQTNPAETVRTNITSVSARRLKEKPPISGNSTLNIPSSTPNERSESRGKTVRVISNSGNKLKNELDANIQSIKDFMNTFTTFNGGFNEFKKEIGIKLTYTERKLLEMEHNSKKKMEELANQIKNFIPINFNAYVKNLDSIKNIQINSNVFNSTGNNFDSERILDKNQSSSVDPYVIMKNKDSYFNNDNVVFVNTKRGKPKKINQNYQKSVPIFNFVEKRLNEGKSISKERKLVNQFVTESPVNDKDQSYSNLDNIRLLKKVEKPRQSTTPNNFPANIENKSNQILKPNYIPLSTVLSNNPESRSKNTETNYVKSIKNSMEKVEQVENKHQIIPKLINK